MEKETQEMNKEHNKFEIKEPIKMDEKKVKTDGI